ncbi:competence protein CoiA family protein [Bacillus atrophaeus]|uniref:competence protein CoiA family protein n=1 Tax=Bacillus atrophaeus TaxID=1452 RepID=UPI00227F1078|nr:competence protein CoiA family protein [Bacillus atrophaeus]
MFSAVTSEGKTVYLMKERYAATEASELRKTKFFCPVCREQLDVKLGSLKAPHFAHKQNKACTIEFEPESAYHLEGKKQLYSWLKAKGCSPVLEPYVKSIQQRPDIIANVQGGMLAFEFQCANLAPDLLYKRTQGLKQAGAEPLWIIGGNRLKRTSRHFFQLSAFHWQFMKENPRQFLLFYCPEARSFYKLHHITPFYANYACASLEAIPLTKANVKDMWFSASAPSFQPAAWQSAITRFRHKPPRFLSKEANHLRLLFYEKRQTPLPFLPPEVFAPIPLGAVFLSPVLIWQGHLYMYITDLAEKRMPIRFSAVFRFCKMQIQKKRIHLRYEYSEQLLREALKQYINFLCGKEFLMEGEKEVYMVKYPVHDCRTLEGVMERDQTCFGE